MKQTLSWNGLGLGLEGPGPYAGLAHSRSKMLLGTILALIWPKPANIFRALCGFTIMYWNAMKIFSLLGRTNFFLLYPVSVEEQSPMNRFNFFPNFYWSERIRQFDSFVNLSVFQKNTWSWKFGRIMKQSWHRTSHYVTNGLFLSREFRVKKPVCCCWSKF